MVDFFLVEPQHELSQVDRKLLSDQGLFQDKAFKTFQPAIERLSQEERENFLYGEFEAPRNWPISLQKRYVGIKNKMANYSFFFQPMREDEEKWLKLFPVILDFFVDARAVYTFTSCSAEVQEKFVSELPLDSDSSYTREELKEYISAMFICEERKYPMNEKGYSLEELLEIPARLYRRYPKSAAAVTLASILTTSQLVGLPITTSLVAIAHSLITNIDSLIKLTSTIVTGPVSAYILLAGVAGFAVLSSYKLYKLMDSQDTAKKYCSRLNEIQKETLALKGEFVIMCEEGVESQRFYSLIEKVDKIIAELTQIGEKLKTRYSEMNQLSMCSGFGIFISVLSFPVFPLASVITTSFSGAVSVVSGAESVSCLCSLKKCQKMLAEAQDFKTEIQEFVSKAELGRLEIMFGKEKLHDFIKKVGEAVAIKVRN